MIRLFGGSINLAPELLRPCMLAEGDEQRPEELHPTDSYQQLAPELDKIMAPSEPIQELAYGFGGAQGPAEGPVWWKEGGYLLFSDIHNNRRMKYTPGHGVSVFQEPTNRANGLTRDLIVPNGLAFSPDESVLYMNDSRRGHIRAFELLPNGTLAKQTDWIFADLRGSEPGVPDDMKVDVAGNVYCGGSGGIWSWIRRAKSWAALSTERPPPPILPLAVRTGKPCTSPAGPTWAPST